MIISNSVSKEITFKSGFAKEAFMTHNFPLKKQKFVDLVYRNGHVLAKPFLWG